MKTFATLAVAVGVLAYPALGFTQNTDHMVTRAELRAELAQLEAAGYNPRLGNDPHYPQDVQTAENRIAMKQDSVQTSLGQEQMTMTSNTGSHTSSDLHVPFVRR